MKCYLNLSICLRFISRAHKYFEPICSWKCYQNREVNLLPQSDMKEIGTPFCLTTYLGINYANFVNWLNTTPIKSYLCKVHGNFVIKYAVISSNFFFGIHNGWTSLHDFYWFDYTWKHVKHLFKYHSISLFIPKHK